MSELIYPTEAEMNALTDSLAPDVKLPAGWGWPPNALRAHYFAENESRSLCGKWAYAGKRVNNNHESPDNCLDCQRRRAHNEAEQEKLRLMKEKVEAAARLADQERQEDLARGVDG